MHRYEELEKKYYKYKLKKVFLFFIIIILLGGSGFALYYVFYKKIDKNNIFLKQDSNISSDNIKDNDASLDNIKNNNTSLSNIKKDKPYYLEFNNSFSKNLKIDKEKNKTSSVILSFNIPKLEEKFKKEKLIMKNETKDRLQQKLSNINSKIGTNKTDFKGDSKIEKKDNKILIKEEKINIDQLIKKFSISPSFKTAIQIAKLYFEKNDLKNSQQWALKANSIDPYKYESWELFALILIKKGKNKKAKEILNIYLNDYGYNEKIEKLLRSLE